MRWWSGGDDDDDDDDVTVVVAELPSYSVYCVQIRKCTCLYITQNV